MIPEWMNTKASIWSEDDCAPDAERLEDAWKRLYGIPRDKEILVDKWDGGDADFYLYESGRIACVSYPGNSEIFEIMG